MPPVTRTRNGQSAASSAGVGSHPSRPVMKRPAAAATTTAPRAAPPSTRAPAARAPAASSVPPSAKKRSNQSGYCSSSEPSPAPPSKRGRGRAPSRDSSPDLAPARHVLSALLNKAGINGTGNAASSSGGSGGAVGPAMRAADPGVERQLATAQQKLQEAEREVVKLKERAAQQESRAERAERALAEQTEQLRQVHVKVAAAEARAQHLSEQASSATDAIERAARAEERAAVMGDLQTKLPLLIRAVIGSVAYPYHQSPYASPGPIKLEFESMPVVSSMEPPSAVPQSRAADSTRSGAAPGTATAGGQTGDAEQEEDGGNQKKGLMQRAMGALSNRRKLQD